MESVESRLNSSGTFSQDSPRCMVKSQIYWADWEKHQKNSQEECGTKDNERECVQMSKSHLYKQRSLIWDNGHSLVQISKRNGILRKRTVHKGFGPSCRKDTEGIRWEWMSNFPCNDSIVQGETQKQRTRKTVDTLCCRPGKIVIVSANQLSLYRAIANMCEECESLHDRSGQLDKVMGQLCSVKSRQKFLRRITIQTIKNFCCSDLKSELKGFHKLIK